MGFFHALSLTKQSYAINTFLICVSPFGVVEQKRKKRNHREEKGKQIQKSILLVKFDYVVQAIKYTANNNKSDT